MAAQQVIVVGQGSSDSYPPVVFVDTISERDALVTNKIVIVRNAYKSDTSVTKGWAAYVLDASRKKWIKIIEQESVDGPWGVNEEIKRNLVTQAQFDALKAIVQRLDPEHIGGVVDWTRPAGNGGISNKPNIEAVATDPATGVPTEWSADFDHLKVGDVKKLRELGSGASFSSILTRLNRLSTILGAKSEDAPVDSFMINNGVFRSVCVGFYNTEESEDNPILVAGTHFEGSSLEGIWYSEDGITLHQTNVKDNYWNVVYSQRLHKWVATSSSAMRVRPDISNDEIPVGQSSSILVSSNGKVWREVSINDVQTAPISIYEDDDTTLFMWGHRLSTDGENWVDGSDVSILKGNTEPIVHGNWSDINDTLGACAQAMPTTINGKKELIVIAANKCQLMDGDTQFKETSMMYTIVDPTELNNYQRIKWTEPTIIGGYPSDIEFCDVQHLIINDDLFDNHYLCITSKNYSNAFCIKNTSCSLGELDKLLYMCLPDEGHGYMEPTICGDFVVVTAVEEGTIYTVPTSSFIEHADSGEGNMWGTSGDDISWNKVTTAENGGSINQTGYYKPKQVSAVIDDNLTTVYVTTQCDAIKALDRNKMLVSYDGLHWYKLSYSTLFAPPIQFGNYLIMSHYGADQGIRSMPLDTFIDILSASASATTQIERVGDEWTEEDLVSKMNQVIDALNTVLMRMA